uniref:Uncharacterized protein n=1 Tax=viral metagenome TaxID=1070528 RepID=A0A6M3L7W5_9ZZZZ
MIKEATAYRMEVIVVDCPYCEEENHYNIEDDIGEGYIPDKGRKMKCQKCEKTMLVVNNMWS